MSVHRFSAATIVAFSLVAIGGCRGPATAAKVSCEAAPSPSMGAAVLAATAHHQTPYATPRLTDRWREREQMRQVTRLAEQELVERNRQSELELAAAPDEQRPRIERATLAVQDSLEQVRAAANAGDRAALRCRYREFVCLSAELEGIRTQGQDTSQLHNAE